MVDSTHSLVPVATPELWVAYHSLRRTALFEDRGLIHHYNANFYAKCGYEPFTWDPGGSFGSGHQMRKLLTMPST